MTFFLPTIGKLLLATTLLFSVSCANESVEEIEASEELSTGAVQKKTLSYAVEPQDGEYYLLWNRGAERFLDVEGETADNGANVNVWQRRKDNSYTQEWRYTEIDNQGQFRLTNRHSGRVLEVGGYKSGNGANLQQWSWVGHLYQRWFKNVTNSDKKVYFIRNMASLKSLIVEDKKTGNGANVEIWKSNHSAWHKWQFIPYDYYD